MKGAEREMAFDLGLSVKKVALKVVLKAEQKVVPRDVQKG